MLTITHTHEAGTLINGTTRGDGAAPILKANRWRWGRSIGAWYLPNSRDRRPQDRIINRTATALETAGFQLAPLEIDRSIRSTAEIEAAKTQRQADRMAALEAKAARKKTAADGAWARAEAARDALPPEGEPVKVGHHSEKRHRSALERAHRRMGQAIAAEDEAATASQRATVAADTTAARYNPVTVANRIQKISAEIRRVHRWIAAHAYDVETGYRPATDEQKARRAEQLAPRLEELNDQLSYWQQVRADQIESGTATNYGRDTVKKGDAVKIRGHWHRVARANAKSVSVETGYSWTDRTPWHEVQDHKPKSPRA